MKRLVQSKMGKKLWQLSKDVLTVLLLVAAYFWSQQRQNDRICQGTLVSIFNSAENHFLESSDIRQAIDPEGNSLVTLHRNATISLQDIERRVDKLTYVKKSQAWKDLAGYVHIDVELHRPVARILRPHGDLYISSNNHIMPMSDKFTARVITISGEGAQKIIHAPDNEKEQVQELTHYIHEIASNPVWRSLIAHIEVDTDFNVWLYPTVGNEVIELGNIQNYAQKMEKLEIYYKKIIPAKGWNTYGKVILKFNNQIICEKKS